jgi:hypothetical protein
MILPIIKSFLRLTEQKQFQTSYREQQQTAMSPDTKLIALTFFLPEEIFVFCTSDIHFTEHCKKASKEPFYE